MRWSLVSEKCRKEAWVWPLPSAFSVPSWPSLCLSRGARGGRSSDPCFPGRPGGSGLGSAFPPSGAHGRKGCCWENPSTPARPSAAGTGGFVRVTMTRWTGETSRSGGAAGRRQDTSCVPLGSGSASPGCPACARDSSQALLIPGELLSDGHVGCMCVCARTHISCVCSPAFLVFSKRHCALTSSACPLGQSRVSPSAP